MLKFARSLRRTPKPQSFDLSRAVALAEAEARAQDRALAERNR